MKKSLFAQPTLTTTALLVSATLDTKMNQDHAFSSILLFLHAPLTPTSMVFPALATLDSSNKTLTHVPLVLQEHHGTEESAIPTHQLPAKMVISST